MRLFFRGPRILGIRPRISFGAEDLFGSRRRPTQRAVGEPMAGSFIYVVRGDHNLVKVGTTTNPRARLASLRTNSAFPIDYSYIAVTPDNSGPLIVRAAHALLKRQRVNGEWFDVAPENAVAALNGAALKLGQPLLQVTLDNADQILRITGYGQLPPADDGYLFGGMPGIFKWPLRIIVGLICGVILLGALSLLFAILNL
jgi:hypothetical protein